MKLYFSFLSLFLLASCTMSEVETTMTTHDAYTFESGTLMANATADPLGNQLAYPEGNPAVTTGMAVWQPGFETGWHYHPYFGAVYVLKGELTVSYDEDTPLSDDANEKSPTRQETYSAGDAFLATPNTWHYSSNQGDEELIFMISWFGEDGQPVRVDE